MYQEYNDWFIAPRKQGRCDCCEKLAEVAWAADPYLLAEYNENIEGWFCWPCYEKMLEAGN